MIEILILVTCILCCIGIFSGLFKKPIGMIRSDRWLKKHYKELGVEKDLINPSSVDLRLGGEIKAFRSRYDFESPTDSYIKSQGWELNKKSPVGDKYDSFKKVYQLNDGEKFHILPDTFYLAHTVERVVIPLDKCALLLLKSTPARQSMSHNLACWFEVNFKGQAVLEITSEILATVTIGKRLIQFVYFDAERADNPYGTNEKSHYQEQAGAQEAWEQDEDLPEFEEMVGILKNDN